MSKAKIVSVRIEHKHDDSADSSYLGKYSDSVADYAIIRVGEHAGEFFSALPEDYDLPSCNREYRFFLPVHENYKGEAETDIRKYCLQDYERIERLNRGDWCYLGIIAKAEVTSPQGIVQTLRSGGLWGVESDSDKVYFVEVAKEELTALRTELESFGFGKRSIDFAFKNITTVDA